MRFMRREVSSFTFQVSSGKFRETGMNWRNFSHAKDAKDAKGNRTLTPAPIRWEREKVRQRSGGMSALLFKDDLRFPLSHRMAEGRGEGFFLRGPLRPLREKKLGRHAHVHLHGDPLKIIRRHQHLRF